MILPHTLEEATTTCHPCVRQDAGALVHCQQPNGCYGKVGVHAQGRLLGARRTVDGKRFLAASIMRSRCNRKGILASGKQIPSDLARISSTAGMHACAVRKVGYFGPVFPDSQGDRCKHCVPTHKTAQILTWSKPPDNELNQTMFHTENTRVLSVFYLNPLFCPVNVCFSGRGWF